MASASSPKRLIVLAGALLVATAACSRPADSQVQSVDTVAPSATTATTATTESVPPVATSAPATAPVDTASASTTTGLVETTTADSTTTDSEGPTAPAATTVPEIEVATVRVQGVDVPALGAGSTPYALPTPQPADFGDGHDYPAVDIFVAGGCGGDVTAPANGTIVEVRREDSYDESVDNPATRGGKSVTMVGDDGVRYYMSHLDSIDGAIEPGVRVELAEHLGIVGTTGRSGACHIHFGISPVCQNKEWSVRRGAIGPKPFLESWRDGGQASPVEAVRQYLAEHPDACAVAEADPNSGDA